MESRYNAAMFRTTMVAILFTLIAIFVGGYVYEILLGKGGRPAVEAPPAAAVAE